MDTNKFILTPNKRKKTFLDKAYSKHINYVIETLDEEQESRWETYNLICSELINQNKLDLFKEIQYRLSDGEDPNFVILEILDRCVDEVDGLVWFLRKRLDEYIEEDFFNKFLK